MIFYEIVHINNVIFRLENLNNAILIQPAGNCLQINTLFEKQWRNSKWQNIKRGKVKINFSHKMRGQKLLIYFQASKICLPQTLHSSAWVVPKGLYASGNRSGMLSFIKGSLRWPPNIQNIFAWLGMSYNFMTLAMESSFYKSEIDLRVHRAVPKTAFCVENSSEL